VHYHCQRIIKLCIVLLNILQDFWQQKAELGETFTLPPQKKIGSRILKMLLLANCTHSHIFPNFLILSHSFSTFSAFGTFFQLFAHFLILSHIFSAFGTLSQLLAHFLSFWQTFAYFLSLWHIISNLSILSQLLAHLISYWHTFIGFSKKF